MESEDDEGSSERRERNNISMITLEEARSIISAAEEKAKQIGQPMNVAVVDAGRNLKAFGRMEDAWLGSIDIAINKAFTAASFELSTQELAGMAQPPIEAIADAVAARLSGSTNGHVVPPRLP